MDVYGVTIPVQVQREIFDYAHWYSGYSNFYLFTLPIPISTKGANEIYEAREALALALIHYSVRDYEQFVDRYRQDSIRAVREGREFIFYQNTHKYSINENEVPNGQIARAVISNLSLLSIIRVIHKCETESLNEGFFWGMNAQMLAPTHLLSQHTSLYKKFFDKDFWVDSQITSESDYVWLLMDFKTGRLQIARVLHIYVNLMFWAQRESVFIDFMDKNSAVCGSNALCYYEFLKPLLLEGAEYSCIEDGDRRTYIRREMSFLYAHEMAHVFLLPEESLGSPDDSVHSDSVEIACDCAAVVLMRRAGLEVQPGILESLMYRSVLEGYSYIWDIRNEEHMNLIKRRLEAISRTPIEADFEYCRSIALG